MMSSSSAAVATSSTNSSSSTSSGSASSAAISSARFSSTVNSSASRTSVASSSASRSSVANSSASRSSVANSSASRSSVANSSVSRSSVANSFASRSSVADSSASRSSVADSSASSSHSCHTSPSTSAHECSEKPNVKELIASFNARAEAAEQEKKMEERNVVRRWRGNKQLGDILKELKDFEGRRESIIGDVSLDSYVKKYETGNEKEDNRLARLNKAVKEIVDVERKFVQFLEEITSLPDHMEKERIVSNKDCAVNKLSSSMIQILPIHRMLLEDLEKVLIQWDSRSPNLSGVYLKMSDCLKCCKSFLASKNSLAEELRCRLKTDKEFSSAMSKFDEKMKAQGRLPLIMELDQVHQNLVRHKLMMENYQKFLVNGEEMEDCGKAIEKLNGIVSSVNQNVGMKENLADLQLKFTDFNVTELGRVLIRKENVKKISFMGDNDRLLVLFNDVIVIGRFKQSGNIQSQLNMKKTYILPLEKVEVGCEIEGEGWALMMKTPERSFKFLFDKEQKVNSWADAINEAIKNHTDYLGRTAGLELDE